MMVDMTDPRNLTGPELLEVVAHAVSVNATGRWPSGREATDVERSWAATFVADVTGALLERSAG